MVQKAAQLSGRKDLVMEEATIGLNGDLLAVRALEV